MTPSLTEIAGESASGKTQLCLQLCLSVQLPLDLGGLDSGGHQYLIVDLQLSFCRVSPFICTALTRFTNPRILTSFSKVFFNISPSFIHRLLALIAFLC